MTKMTDIQVFECAGCGNRVSWPDPAHMPLADHGLWKSDCPRCGEYQRQFVRTVEIAETDLRWLLRFADGKFLDLTDCT